MVLQRFGCLPTYDSRDNVYFNVFVLLPSRALAIGPGCLKDISEQVCLPAIFR